MGEIIGWGWWEQIRQITKRFKKNNLQTFFNVNGN